MTNNYTYRLLLIIDLLSVWYNGFISKQSLEGE